MPATAANIYKQLGIADDISKSNVSDIKAWGRLTSGLKIAKGKPLFPRIEI